MISNYNDFKEYLNADFRSKEKRVTFMNIIRDPILRFTFFLHLNEFLLNTRKPVVIRLIPYYLFKRLSVRLGFSIPLNVFNQGLSIVHYGLIVVSPFARIGKNCRIHAGVNIGGTAGFIDNIECNKIYAPNIGDNCYIGPGAKLFGPITVGNDCVVGANAVLNKTFNTNGCTIAGVPAKIISYKNSEELIIKGSTV